MQNIERACFTALNASINDAFKVLNNPNVRGWHAGMRVIDILDQLSSTYEQPTPSALKANDHIFQSPTLAANAPEVFFRRIKECAKKALLGKNPYTDRQLITNTIRLLLTTGIYIRAFEDWDQLAEPVKTWIKLTEHAHDHDSPTALIEQPACYTMTTVRKQYLMAGGGAAKTEA